MPTVSLGNGDGVEAVGRHGLEAEPVAVGKGRKWPEHSGAHDECGGGQRRTAAQETSPREDLLGQPAEVGLHERGIVHFIERFGHRLLCACVGHLPALIVEF